jgi:hypothetical protein
MEDDETRLRVPDTVCDSVRTVLNYLPPDSTDRAEDFNLLVSRVLEQEEADRRERQEAEATRQQEMTLKKQMEDD